MKRTRDKYGQKTLKEILTKKELEVLNKNKKSLIALVFDGNTFTVTNELSSANFVFYPEVFNEATINSTSSQIETLITVLGAHRKYYEELVKSGTATNKTDDIIYKTTFMYESVLGRYFKNNKYNK